MEVVEVFSYILIGLLAGVLAGLLGISGGVITVPCLFFIFKYMGFSKLHLMHYAIGTSMAAMIFNSLSATYFHNKRGSVLWDVIKVMLPGIFIGSLGGAFIADLLSGVILQICFGFFALLVGIYFLKPHALHEGHHRLPSPLKLSGISFGVSFMSNILGIGGGIITVPILMAYKVSDQKAIASSSAITLLITSLGALAYLFFGLNEAPLKDSIGFIYIPAFCIIAATTFFAAPLGVKLAHQLSAKTLRRIFACALILTGITMILH